MKSSLFVRLTALLAAAIFLSPFASAQGWIHTWYGDVGYQSLGESCSDLGDIDGDGYADIILGAPRDKTSAIDAGMARIYSGGTGFKMWEGLGWVLGDAYGFSVSGAGDLNGDGTPDFLIGAPNADFNGQGSGRVYAYSGAGFQFLYSVDGIASLDWLGVSLSDAGDVNNDGYDDFIAGAWEYGGSMTSNGDGTGYARVYSGVNGSVLHTIVGAGPKDFCGRSVGGAGDINGDGFDDFMIGSYGRDNGFTNSGNVSVYSGATGAILLSMDGIASKDKIGLTCHNAGDTNGDGVNDIIAGGYGQTGPNGANCGVAMVFSGADGSMLHTWYGDNQADYFGSAVGGGQDLDQDGFSDVVVGIYNDDSTGGNAGAMRAYSGDTGLAIFTAYGDSTHDLMGYSVSMTPDVNGDGVPDAVSGGLQYDGGPGPGNGTARVWDPTVAPPPPPPHWFTLPTTFVSVGAGYMDDFESYGGVVPSHFGINALDTFRRQPSGDAWCNIGQMGPCTGGVSGLGPFSGSFGLEMGNEPLSTTHANVANALIIGLDGTGAGSLVLNMKVLNHGEETNDDDGVFVSENGLDWTQVQTGWSALPVGVWSDLNDVDLSGAGVSTDGPFYLCIAQEDNYPIGDGDGVNIDDISVVASGPAGYTIDDIVPGVVGTMNSINVSGASPGQPSHFTYGFSVGNTNIPGCSVDVGIRRAKLAGYAMADAAGNVSYVTPVPPSVAGITVYIQALEHAICEVTNVYAHTF